jgi:FMN phosphatase YigB (HAD superfamily)
VHLLKDLRNRYELLLVTSGSPEFQERKVDHLGIRDLFQMVKVLNCGGSKTSAHGRKEDVIREIIKHPPGDVVVIGNRLDQEIRAGKQLGMKTIWVRQGEGAAMQPDEDSRPDFEILKLMDLPAILSRIEASKVLRFSPRPQRKVAPPILESLASRSA